MTTNESKIFPQRRSLESTLAVDFIDPVNDARWDSFVERHPYGWLTHHSSWKKVIERSFEHMKGYYPVLVDRHNGEIEAALPVFEVKSWLTGRKLVSIPWATLSDPLVTRREEFDLLVREVEKLMGKLGAKHLEIRSLYTAALIENGTPAEQPRYIHHYLNLDQDLECMKKLFHRSCVQQRIKKALASDLTLKIGENEEDLKSMYALHLQNRNQKNLPPQPYVFFKNMWDILHPEKRISLLTAEYGGKPIASLLLFKFKDRISAEVAHMDENYRSKSPNIFLFWEAIRQAVSEGYKIFDFGRTSPTNQSLITFKSRWNTNMSDITFYYYPVEKSPELATTYSYQYNMIKLICKYTPDFVQPYIGSFCYRHTG
jgi:hypothetical protein